MSEARPIPEGFTTITPHLVVKNAGEALDFYQRAFGAEETNRLTGPDGASVMHAEMRIGNAKIMVADEFPDWGSLGPKSIGGTPVVIHLYVEDVDRAFKRAVDAGAEVTMPVEDTFWGDRYGKITDPYGHHWSIATHVKDMTNEEIGQAAAAAFGGGS